MDAASLLYSFLYNLKKREKNNIEVYSIVNQSVNAENRDIQATSLEEISTERLNLKVNF